MKLFRTLATTGTVLLASFLSTTTVQAADINLSIGSCPVGCTAYTWSAGIAEVINNNVDGVRVTAEETKGYVANIKLMQSNQLEISMATSLSSYQAYAGTGPYEGSPKGDILSWMAIAPVAMHVITLKDGPVQSLEDLKGKRVGMGQPGGVSMLDADAMMAILGLTPDEDFEPFRIRLGGMADGLADGNLDAALWNGSFPLPPVVKLTANRTPTFGLANGMVLSKDIPEDIVYNMTKAIFENLEGLTAVHPAFGRVTKESVLNGFGAPLHPGALKYYREIGVPGIEEFVTRTAE